MKIHIKLSPVRSAQCVINKINSRGNLAHIVIEGPIYNGLRIEFWSGLRDEEMLYDSLLRPNNVKGAEYIVSFPGRCTENKIFRH